MFKNFEKFLKNLQKLDEYYILRQEDDFVIVGTTIIIKEHQEMLGNIFQPRTQNVDRKIPTFFFIFISEVPFDNAKEFKNKKIPILYLDKYQLAKGSEAIKEILDNFVSTNIKS